MPNRPIPFENRWTSGSQARHWLLRLEREGEPNVRAIYADHEVHAPDERMLIEDIPAGFARDWLASLEELRRRRRRNRHRVVVVLLLIAIIGIAIIAWRITP